MNYHYIVLIATKSYRNVSLDGGTPMQPQWSVDQREFRDAALGSGATRAVITGSKKYSDDGSTCTIIAESGCYKSYLPLPREA